jgi:hypothetical protein
MCDNKIKKPREGYKLMHLLLNKTKEKFLFSIMKFSKYSNGDCWISLFPISKKLLWIINSRVQYMCVHGMSQNAVHSTWYNEWQHSLSLVSNTCGSETQALNRCMELNVVSGSTGIKTMCTTWKRTFFRPFEYIIQLCNKLFACDCQWILPTKPEGQF